jgi:hypothetical protein
MGALSISGQMGVGLAPRRSGGGTPTPTPSITAPVITQTSTTGANPFLWTTAENATFFPGYFWNVQTASDALFTAQPPSNIVFGGDSWVTDYVGYYAGYYKSQHPSLAITNQSVGGTGIAGTDGLVSFEYDTIAANPRIYHIGVGRNDLTNTVLYPTPQDWLNALLAHITRIKAGCPAVKVTVETLVGQQVTGQSTANAAYNAARAIVNPLIRAAVGGGLIDAVVDFAANGTLGPDAALTPAAASSTTISVDGLHLYSDDNMAHSTGHGIAYPIFAAVIDAQVTATTLPAGSVTADVVQEILPGDLSGTDPVVFTDLTTTSIPGLIYLRERVGKDDGLGGYTYGAWSNVLSDTLAATSTAVLATTNGVNKSQYVDVTGTPKLTATLNAAIGAIVAVRTTTVAVGKKHFEVTINSVGSSGGLCEVGLVDSSVALGSAVFTGIHAGSGSNAGCSVFINGTSTNIYSNGGSGSGSSPALTTGDIIVVEFDTTANTATFWHKRGATVTSLASITLTSNIPTNWTAYVGGAVNTAPGDSVTVNFGATTFSKTPTSGYGIYG